MSQPNDTEAIENGASVTVTHCNSPAEFYCRLLVDRDKFNKLQTLIDENVQSNQAALPVITQGLGIVLVYSITGNCWCRAQLICYNRDKQLRPINAKVRLVDFGSIEIVLWKKEFVLASTDAIDSYNDGKGFCFKCSLGNIRPWNSLVNHNKTITNHEWSSYATFLLEKETRNQDLVLVISNQSDSLIVCDLMPRTSERSLSNHLVNENVARFASEISHLSSNYYEQDNKENHCLV